MEKDKKLFNKKVKIVTIFFSVINNIYIKNFIHLILIKLILRDKIV